MNGITDKDRGPLILRSDDFIRRNCQSTILFVKWCLGITSFCVTIGIIWAMEYNEDQSTLLGITIVASIALGTVIAMSYGLWLQDCCWKVPFEIYENGIVCPIRSHKQYRKGEVSFIPYNDVASIEMWEGEWIKGWDGLWLKKKGSPEEYLFLGFFIGVEAYESLKNALREKCDAKWTFRECKEKTWTVKGKKN